MDIKKYTSCICLGCVMALLVSGCQSTGKKQAGTPGFEHWQTMTEMPVNPASVPAAAAPPQPAPEPQISRTGFVPEPGPIESAPETPAPPVRQLPDMPVSMKMHEVSVAVLLRTLARAADMNIMINETVSGNANINISNVPWSQAFEGLLNTYGLTWKWSGDVLRIITVEDLNKEIALMDATQKFERSKKEHAIAMLTIQQEKEKLDPLHTEIIKVDYANLEMLRDNIESYLLADKKEMDRKTQTDDKRDAGRKTELRGAILMDPGTSSLIIQATKSDLDKIKPIIQKLDRPTYQILIEANIVEANSDTAKELGVQWGGLGVNMSGDKNTWLGGPIGEGNMDLFDTNQPPIGTALNFPSSETAGTPGWEGMALGLLHQKIGSYLLTAQLTALERQGKIRILSRPSITTMDNRKASIESGQEVPFQTVDEDGRIKIEFKKAVIKLEVTPHVIDGDAIRLMIITHKDELDWTRTVLGNPTIITKNAQTEVYLNDGQTTVIGGLNKEKTLEREAGVPFLKDLPGIGRLFRNNADSAEMEELMIFLTPRILGADQAAVALDMEN